MLKSLFAAIAIATAVTGAAALADGKVNGGGTNVQSASAVIEGRDRHVDCRDQVWPNIDSQCLSPVSEKLSVRSARVVEL